MIFETNYRVGLNHIGLQGKITNVGLLSILEESAEMHSSTIGLGVNTFSKTRINMGST